MKNKGVSAVEKFYIIFHAVNEFEWQRHLKYKNSIFEDPPAARGSFYKNVKLAPVRETSAKIFDKVNEE
jgi:hypothetical protein